MEQAKQKEKLYTVAQVAILLKTSAVTIYNKIKKLDLENEIIKNNRTTYLTERAIELIKENMCIDTIETEKEDTELVIILKEQIEHLKEQIEKKDKQLERKDTQLENFQVLLKTEQERTLLLENKTEKEELTEEIATTVDYKNKEIKEEKHNKKRFFFFNRK